MITQLLVSISDLDDCEHLNAYLYNRQLRLALIHIENGQRIYYTHCYIKNPDSYFIMDVEDEHVLLCGQDIHYNHIHERVKPIFFPFDSEDTYSIIYNSVRFGRFAITVFVEKPYYKYWLIQLLPIDIDVMTLLQTLLLSFN